MKKLKDGKYLLENVRLAFPHLTEISDRTKKYGAAFIFAKDSAEAKGLEKVLEAILTEKFKDAAEKVKTACERKGRWPLHDGDEKEDLAGYAGNAFVNANSRIEVPCYDRDRSTLDEKHIKEKMYSGAIVNAIIAPYAFDNDYGKGVGIGLQGVQFVADADRFSGGGVAKGEDFPELAPAESNNDDMFAEAEEPVF